VLATLATITKVPTGPFYIYQIINLSGVEHRVKG